MKNFRLFVLCAGFCGGAHGQLQLNQVPSRVIGQPSLTASAPNLVEGKELNSPLGVAVDTSASPPRLYVADTANNRVLGWRDAQGFQNGSKADLVIGQKDFFSTTPSGAGTDFVSGLFRPVGIAADTSGNLFVVDSGNNRVVRYAQPFNQQDVVLADIVIGQMRFSDRAANQGSTTPTERTISTNPNNSTNCSACLYSTMAFDGSGNLWLTDPGNNRVLRYPASVVTSSAKDSGPPADLVLGMNDFTTRPTTDNIAPNTAAGRADKTRIRAGDALAFDPDGNLFFADDLNRVLVYRPPFVNNKPAERIMGLAPPGTPSNQVPLGEYGMGGGSLGGVRGVFFIDRTPFVVDTANSRILRFDPYYAWPNETPELPSPAAKAVIGQDGFYQGRPNRADTNEPNAWSFAAPSYAVYGAGTTFVADTANNRALAFDEAVAHLSTGPPAATVGSAIYFAQRVAGQFDMGLRPINLLEGKEMTFGLEVSGSALIPYGLVTAIDTSGAVPRLYVADTGNNRVLGYSDYRRVLQGLPADIVIGQVDFRRNLVNSPGNDANRPTDTGLRAPAGLAVDSEGNLWVADRGNGRVLRFPAPFAQASPVRADVVLGQASFSEKITDATARTMAAPYGLALTGAGDVVVSDASHNRVLLFVKGNGFTNGQAASIVLGQVLFTNSFTGNNPNQLNGPRHIAVDTDDRLYVCDLNNNRVQIFERVTTQASGNNANVTFPVSTGPVGIDVSKKSGEIWVNTLRGNAVLRFPRFDQLILNPASNGSVTNAGALFTRIDPGGNLLVSDTFSRVALYFPSMGINNAASGFLRLAPAMLATVYLQTSGPPAVNTPVVVDSNVFPKVMGDIAATVKGLQAPLYYVYPYQIAIQIPKDAAGSGLAEIVVYRVSTSEILAVTEVRMDVASPAFFTEGSTGTGQIAAINQDGTINNVTVKTDSAGKVIQGPGERSKVVSLYLTGQGNIAGMPDDGQPPATTVPTPPEAQLRVFIGTKELEQSQIQYSGLGGGYPGLWQINAVIPDATVPGINPVVILYRGFPSNINPVTGGRVTTTIAVK